MVSLPLSNAARAMIFLDAKPYVCFCLLFLVSSFLLTHPFENEEIFPTTIVISRNILRNATNT